MSILSSGNRLLKTPLESDLRKSGSRFGLIRTLSFLAPAFMILGMFVPTVCSAGDKESLEEAKAEIVRVFVKSAQALDNINLEISRQDAKVSQARADRYQIKGSVKKAVRDAEKQKVVAFEAAYKAFLDSLMRLSPTLQKTIYQCDNFDCALKIYTAFDQLLKFGEDLNLRKSDPKKYYDSLVNQALGEARWDISGNSAGFSHLERVLRGEESPKSAIDTVVGFDSDLETRGYFKKQYHHDGYEAESHWLHKTFLVKERSIKYAEPKREFLPTGYTQSYTLKCTIPEGEGSGADLVFVARGNLLCVSEEDGRSYIMKPGAGFAFGKGFGHKVLNLHISSPFRSITIGGHWVGVKLGAGLGLSGAIGGFVGKYGANAWYDMREFGVGFSLFGSFKLIPQPYVTSTSVSVSAED